MSADDSGGSIVAAVDPVALFAVVARPGLEGLAEEVRGRLIRVIAALDAS